MTVDNALKSFIELEKAKYQLSEWDIKNLSYGFVCGAKYAMEDYRNSINEEDR